MLYSKVNKNNTTFVFLLLFVFIFAVYANHTATGVTAYGDAEELLTAGYFMSVAHPPGYPLHITLTWLFTHLPLPGSIAYQAHLLSAFLHSLVVCFLFLSSLELLQIYEGRRKEHHYVISLASAFTLAFSYLFWLYSEVNEVFALNNLFAIILILLSLRYYRTKQAHLPWMIAILFGLAIGHHQTIILILPALFYLYSATPSQSSSTVKKSSQLFKLFLTSSLSFGLTLCLLLFIENSQSPYHWQANFSTFEGLWSYITRQDFTGYVQSDGQQMNAYLKNVSLIDTWHTAKLYFGQFLIDHFGYTGVLVSLLSVAVVLWKTTNRLKFFLLLLLVPPAILFPLYVAIPAQLQHSHQSLTLIATTQRMYLLGYTMLAAIFPLGFLGIWHFSQWILTTYLHKSKQNLSKYTLSGILFLFPLLSLWNNYQTTDLSSYQNLQNYVDSLITSTTDVNDEPALLICFSDLSCFPLLYTLTVERTNLQIQLLAVPPQMQIANSLQLPIQYPDNPFRIINHISWHLQQDQPVFVTEFPDPYSTLLGVENSAFFLSADNVAARFDCQPHDLQTQPEVLKVTVPDSRDFYQRAFVAFIAERYQLHGSMLARSGDLETARHFLNYSQQLFPDSKTASLLDQLHSYTGDQRYLNTDKCLTAMDMIAKAMRCRDHDNEACAYQNLVQAVALEPDNVQARLLLAQAYLNQGFVSLAKREYEFVLVLDPANQVAQLQLALPDLKYAPALE